ncbi:hypothetical protein FO519_004781 [Halicephalobus sp. NKZ332]|nr:hypothetical protein FO519_004781 [Halicephalobus sp. NKZ332]
MEPSEIVQLNIGGTGYTTTMRTLSREPESFFPQLFAGDGLDRYSHVASKMADGSIFVDRDGELFVYILDYLRSGKLILPDNFKETARLREEVLFYQLEGLSQLLTPYYNLKYPTKALTVNGGSVVTNAIGESGGFITIGYRGTFAFGRDGQADVKFRKLHRILVCGKVTLCREVFGDTLNESRDPGGEGAERYTARLYLKHQCLEKACDNLVEKGFKLIASCSSGANGLAAPSHSMLSAQASNSQQNLKEYMNQRNSGDFEEQRWAHFTQLIFYREPQGECKCGVLANPGVVSPVLPGMAKINGENSNCPKFVSLPSFHLSPESELLNIDICFTCNGKHEIVWKHEEEIIASNGRRTIKTKGQNSQVHSQVSIDKPTIKDSGIYSVEVLDKDSGLSARKRFKLNLKAERSKEQPLYMVPPSEFWLDGSKLGLRFNVRSAHSLNVNWTKDDEEIEASEKFEKVLKNLGNNEHLVQLIISQPGENETGNYSCIVKNEFGQLKTIFKVEGKISKNAPLFLKKPKVYEKIEDDQHFTVFKVVFKGRDENPRITWFNPRNQVIENSERYKITLKPSKEEGSWVTTLELTEYESRDNGVFCCHVRNRTGKDSALAEFLFNVEIPETGNVKNGVN